ncbi:hypothetical protein N431DRAFT_344057 [Stipitochalara longipes BDJ]|nr:hypothetical protein N431DRAFT_344057 [Stipitochalara longipes BDJ]
MPITVGSVGDIISLILLTKDVIECLNSSRGSGAEYQELIKELWVLERTLLEVEALSRSSDKTVELNALCATTRRAADHCRHSLNEFLDKIKKYKVGLRESGSGNALQDAKSKLQWRLFARDDVAKFRSELCAHTSSIGMLLTIASVRNHGLGADMQKTALEEVRKQLEENNSLIKEHNKSLADITEVPRLQWVKQIGCDIKYMMFKIFAVNIAMYKAVLNIQAGLPSSLERALIQEPFILEDAIGRIAPIHMQFISSWEAFEAVLELRFRNAPGYRKVQNRKYTFQEHGTKKDIVRTRPWDASFLPGQKIDMSLIYKGFEKEGAGSVCPACRNPSVEAQDTEVQW